VLQREDPRDVLVVAPGQPGTLRELARGAHVGTSSLRRRALLLAQRPDLVVEDLRGNLDTRLNQVKTGRYDAAILAYAGLKRLSLDDQVTQVLDAPDWLPAVGQGALAVITRGDDRSTRGLVAQLDDPHTRAATIAERALLATLEGGCQIPIGALATVDSELTLHAFVASVDGKQFVRGKRTGAPAAAATVGRELAAELLNQGARQILEQLRAAQSPAPAAP
jgi:hydroxymethylbilane synthase